MCYWIINVDYKSVKWFYNLSTTLIIPLKIISLLGTIQFWILFTIILFIYGILFNQSMENFSVLLFTGIVVSLMTVSVVKRIVRRKRPYMDEKLHEYTQQKYVNREPYISKQQQSFPSGHMYFLVMEAIFFYVQFGFWALFPFLILTPLIFVSRIHLGVHFLSDVLMGMIMGLVFGILTQIIFDKYLLPLYLNWVGIFL